MPEDGTGPAATNQQPHSPIDDNVIVASSTTMTERVLPQQSALVVQISVEINTFESFSSMSLSVTALMFNGDETQKDHGTPLNAVR